MTISSSNNHFLKPTSLKSDGTAMNAMQSSRVDPLSNINKNKLITPKQKNIKNKKIQKKKL